MRQRWRAGLDVQPGAIVVDLIVSMVQIVLSRKHVPANPSTRQSLNFCVCNSFLKTSAIHSSKSGRTGESSRICERDER